MSSSEQNDSDSRRSRFMPAVFFVAGLVTAVAAAAHHSYGMFDQSVAKTLDGTVVSFEWSNPHAWLHVAVRDKATVTTWNVELGPPVSLSRTGMKRLSMKPGDKVQVIIAPLKGDLPGGHMIQITTAGGDVFNDPVFKLPTTPSPSPPPV